MWQQASQNLRPQVEALRAQGVPVDEVFVRKNCFLGVERLAAYQGPEMKVLNVVVDKRTITAL